MGGTLKYGHSESEKHGVCVCVCVCVCVLFLLQALTWGIMIQKLTVFSGSLGRSVFYIIILYITLSFILS